LPEWKPDFGPDTFIPGTGASIIGAREFLVAYNVNLDSKSADVANEIAKTIRQSGYIQEREEGSWRRIPGRLNHVKAIGWYIEEYGFAQVSMNLTNLNVTPIHTAFNEVCDLARAMNVEVTGSEIIGLVSQKTMFEAGKYFLKKQGLNGCAPENEIVNLAVTALGLSQVKPFVPEERIIELVIKNSKVN